jgi:hypothetical protein
MGLPANSKPRRRRWLVALIVVAAIPAGLWLWLEWLGRINADPSLAARTPVPTEAGVLHPNFSGDWKIDLEASESMTPILKLKGRSTLECVVLAKVPMTHVIRGDYRRYTIVIQTPVRDQSAEVYTDGRPIKALDPEGKETVAVTRWSEDGQSLVTTSTDTLNGQPAQMKMTRSLAPDGRTMYVDLEFTCAQTSPIRVRRVFRLIALPAEEAAP